MPAEATSADARRRAAREVIDILHEIATLLVCTLSLTVDVSS
jgi:mitotic-spindle organizing protein 1